MIEIVKCFYYYNSLKMFGGYKFYTCGQYVFCRIKQYLRGTITINHRFSAISGLNNVSDSNSAADDLHHQIVDNERFMMKYAAANPVASDSHHRPKVFSDEPATTATFAEQNRPSKKLNPSSNVQSGTFFPVKKGSKFTLCVAW